MKISRLRSGEAIALFAALLLAVLLGLDWFSLSTPDARVGASESGIASVGWFAAILILLAIICAIVLAFFTIATRATALPVVFGVLTTLFGFIAFLTIAFRLIFQPGLGLDAGNADVDVELPAYLALVTAALLTYGGWRTMADERTKSREALEQTEDVLRVRGAPRPAPPPTIGDA